MMPDEKATRELEGTGLDDLLRGPSCRRMLGHVDVSDPGAVDAEHEEDVDAFEGDGGQDSEVDGEHFVAEPALRFAGPSHPTPSWSNP